MEIHCPHDKVFKKVMSDIRIATDFLEQYLLDSIQALIDFSTLKLESGSYIDEQLQSTSSDLLYSVNIAGEKSFIYVLCEHQSKVNDFMPFKLLKYEVNIWDEYLKKTQLEGEKTKKLPLIIPIVFYHGKKPWDGKRRLQDLIDAPEELIEEMLFKPFHLIDMHTIEDDALR